MLDQEINLLDDFPAVDYEQWRAVVESDLKGAPFDKKLITHTYEGIDIHPVYTAKDWPAAGNPSGYSGLDPFTRGRNPLGNSVCGWDIRQECLDPDLERANASMLDDLQRGVLSLQLRMDVAGRNGLDPNDSEKELCGRDGMMLYSVADVQTALKEVHLDAITVALEAGAAFLPAAGMFIAAYDAAGIDRRSVKLAINADPFAVFVRDGKLPVTMDAALQQMADLACWADANLPQSTTIRVGTGPYHHAGATAVQDIAYAMATAVAYLRTLTDAGLTIDAAAKQLLFNFNVGTNQFLAIAKLRAARKLYTRILEACGASVEPDGDNPGQAMNMHVRTSKRVITSRDPWVNMLRNTVTTFAGAVAGAQVITVEPFDKALSISSDFARRIARNTQIILMEESHLNRVIDPAGGCWFIESLTDELAAKAYEIFKDIEAQGGMQALIEGDNVRDQIDSTFEPRLKNIATRRDAVTGVSEFPNLTEKQPQPLKTDYEQLFQNAKTCLEAVIADCSMIETIESTVGLARVDAVVGAMAQGATIGQVYAALKQGQESSLEVAALAPFPYAKPFEELRDASDNYLALTGTRPRVFLANMGPIAHFTARATYSRNFFEAGGFEVIADASGHQGEGREDVEGAAEKAAKAFAQSGANIAVICSSDAIYPDMVPVVTNKLKEIGARTVILAGFPADHKAQYDEAGIDRYIYMKCDVLGTLRELMQEEGVL